MPIEPDALPLLSAPPHLRTELLLPSTALLPSAVLLPSKALLPITALQPSNGPHAARLQRRERLLAA
jgi:hypothetical protein